MKQLIPLTALAALLAASSLHAQTPAFSKPSGYETINLQPGFNFVGIRLVESAVVSGTFTANTSTSLTDANASFALDANTLYLVEFGGTGSLNGLILEALGSSFSGTTLSGLTGVNADYLTSYTIRPAQTLSGVFGSGSDVLLTKGTQSTGDLVFVPNAQGGFDTYYHTADVVLPNSTVIAGGWRKVGAGGTNQSATPLNYLDGFYVQIRGNEKSLVVTGQVKTSSTLLPAPLGFSYFSSIYPVGATLGTSGLANSVLKGTQSSGDLILLPDGTGGFLTFFHTADVVLPNSTVIPGGWRRVGAGGTDQSTQPITAGFILQRRGASTNLNFSPPSNYNSL